MKNMIKKLRKDKNEKGSGIILVIVALSFLGILAGALLTAVAYAYRLKLYDYNAKDNFHYVEQAMDEVYAGLGGRTTTTMQDAYTKTVEEMVYFDPVKKAYTNIGDAEANKRFKDKFMNGIKDDAAFTNIETLTKLIQSYISNSSVTVVNDNMRVVYYKMDGSVALKIDSEGASGEISASLKDVELSKIVIQNLVLRRTANYQRSSASGTFTQTISTDVEISRPDFNVQFNTVSADSSVLYDYALIADSGIEVNKSAASPLFINGNVYGGADFYNKDYNQYGVSDANTKEKYAKLNDDITNNLGVTIRLDPVLKKTHSADGTFLINARLADLRFGNGDGVLTYAEYTANKAQIINNKDLLYNGYNENSRYSGLYINGAKVSIMADTVVVPGSIAVMNGANLSVYNSTGAKVEKSSVWADNVILGGYNYAYSSGVDSNNQTVISYAGSKATFIANMYIRDDLEVNADNSDFSLMGGYYGYGNGTQTKRAFVPTIATELLSENNNVNIYQQGTNSSNAVDRSHYNSSAIVINGEKSTLDLTFTTTLYIAGQAYLELSAKHEDVDYKVDEGSGEIVYATNSPDKQNVTKEKLTFDPRVQDYKTGESLSVKSNQLIYIPNGTGKYDNVKDPNDGKVLYQTIAINPILLAETTLTDGTEYNLFKKFFKDTSKVPCVSVVPAKSNRTYHYFDFEKIFAEDNKGYESAEAMAAAFAEAYMEELNKSSSSVSKNFSPIKEYLDQDVTNSTLFNAGEIKLPEFSNDDVDVYASGALTGIKESIGETSTKTKTYNIIVKKESGITRPTTAKGDTAVGDTSSSANSILLANDFAKHYNYLKFALVDLASGSADADLVDSIVASSSYGEAALSPINRYFSIKNFYNVEPTSIDAAENLDNKLNLSSGYKVLMSDGDVELDSSYCDSDGVIRGIVVSQGDVYFKAGVKKFEGLIVAGGKIYIANDVTAISASPEICKAILTELQTEKDPDAEKVLRVFVGYKSAYDSMSLEDLKTLCDQRDITYDENVTDADRSTLISKLIAYDNSGDNTEKKINTIDYSDVVKYSNWMKNSE